MKNDIRLTLYEGNYLRKWDVIIIPSGYGLESKYIVVKTNEEYSTITAIPYKSFRYRIFGMLWLWYIKIKWYFKS